MTDNPLHYSAEEVAEAAIHDPLPKEPKTELGYAHRLIEVYGDELRFVPQWGSSGRWLVWDSRRWALDTTGQAQRWMKVIARRLTTDVLNAKGMAEAERKAAMNLARKAESAASVRGALSLASTESGIVVTPDNLDADPFLLNCTNGTLDLRTGGLHDHDPADLLTKMTRTAYDPEANGAEWEKFLARVQPDPGMRAYLGRLTGQGLEGRTASHILPIFNGTGANGKTTFIGAVDAALGDYSDAADPELLVARSFDAHPTGVADLFGLRLAILHETDKGRRLAEATVKRLTGGDRLKARRMRENFWSFDPSHTFVMLTNHKPVISGTDEGIWRRIKLVPWEVVIPGAERDEDLGDKLALELDAVLAFLVRGYQDWHSNGLCDPAAVTAATAAYRAESDALGRFINERCLTGPHFRARSSELFAAWCKWCAGEGEDAGTQTAFSKTLTELGYDKHKSGGVIWAGLGLAAEDSEDGDGEG